MKFLIDQWNLDYTHTHTHKERNVFNTQKIKSTNIWVQYQKICISLNDVVDEYSNTYHGTIKMNPVVVKSSVHIDFSIENNNKGPKFEIGDCIGILKY